MKSVTNQQEISEKRAYPQYWLRNISKSYAGSLKARFTWELVPFSEVNMPRTALVDAEGGAPLGVVVGRAIAVPIKLQPTHQGKIGRDIDAAGMATRGFAQVEIEITGERYNAAFGEAFGNRTNGGATYDAQADFHAIVLHARIARDKAPASCDITQRR